ncbi:MAG: hypothetical protein BZY88_03190 [SAR202 cluster bacterium Io17-Chloro-G9]|nr:MAG: hypothetical protein BZY88_03190 [SAR202 cluster bacterium Io17-Chloro-G9]
MSSDLSNGETVYDSPFARLLEIRPGVSEGGRGSALMEIKTMHRQAAGAVQGGIIVTLADYAFHRAVRSVGQPEQTAVTVELKLNFIAPAREGELTATAHIINQGRRLVVGEMEVTDQNQTLIARGLGTYMLLRPGA